MEWEGLNVRHNSPPPRPVRYGTILKSEKGCKKCEYAIDTSCSVVIFIGNACFLCI
jgi:hypothetical protein